MGLQWQQFNNPTASGSGAAVNNTNVNKEVSKTDGTSEASIHEEVNNDCTQADSKQNILKSDETIISEDEQEINDIMQSQIEARLNAKKEEAKADLESKTGLNTAWNAAKEFFDTGTAGSIKQYYTMPNKLNDETQELSREELVSMYEITFGEKPNFEELKEISETTKALKSGDGLTLDNGEHIKMGHIKSELRSQIDKAKELLKKASKH